MFPWVYGRVLTEHYGWGYITLNRDNRHLAVGDLPDVPSMVVDLKRRHVCAVVDGVIRDTWNAADRYGNGRLARVAGVWVPGT